MPVQKLEPAFTFTEVQEALLNLRSGYKKVAVEIGTSTPLRFCTGRDPVTYGGDVYEPRGLELGEISIAGAGKGTSLTLDNTDGNMTAANFSETFSGKTVTAHFFLRRKREAWTHVLSLEWTCETLAWNLSAISLELSWGVGTRPKAGLEVASQRCALASHWNNNNTPKGGPLCQYNGADTRCTGTWDDCVSKSNTDRFRGFRLAPPPGYSLKVQNGSFQFQGGYGGIDPPPNDSGDDPEMIYRGPGGRRVTPDPPPSGGTGHTPVENPHTSSQHTS
jgi:hypothetical protein